MLKLYWEWVLFVRIWSLNILCWGYLVHSKEKAVNCSKNSGAAPLGRSVGHKPFRRMLWSLCEFLWMNSCVGSVWNILRVITSIHLAVLTCMLRAKRRKRNFCFWLIVKRDQRGGWIRMNLGWLGHWKKCFLVFLWLRWDDDEITDYLNK